MKIPEEKIDGNIFYIAKKLSDNGFKSYLVGGAVRDIIFGRQPNDFDLLTDATCDQVIKIFKSVVPYGMKHGTVIVVVNKTPYDVTSYNEGEAPTGSLENDLGARDFTINAMACGLDDLTLIDPFDGLSDFNARTIRCVLNPRDRFKKDPLRMLRAIRQAAQFCFTIEENTYATIEKMAADIALPANERVAAELTKLFDADSSGKCAGLLINSGLWLEIIKKNINREIKTALFNKSSLRNGVEKAAAIIKNETYVLRFALFLLLTLMHSDDGDFKRMGLKPIYKFLHRLKFSKEDFELISAAVFLAREEILAEKHREKDTRDPEKISRLVKRDIVDYFSTGKVKHICGEVYTLCAAYYRAAGDGCNESKYILFSKCFKKIMDEKQPVYIEDLAINGESVMEKFGLPRSSLIGEMLKVAQDVVIYNPNENVAEVLLQKIALWRQNK